jgi:LysM repeat protein
MKPTQSQFADTGDAPASPRSDRLTQLLIWAAFILLAALAALVADIWLWPASEVPVVQAIGPTDGPPSPSPAATPLAAISPSASIAITASTVSTLPVTPPPCVPPDDWGLQVVQEGNTLFSLAQRYGTDVDTLMRVNCLNTFTIFLGQRLYVPGPAATPTPIVPLSTPPPAPTDTPRPGASATFVADAGAAPTRVPTATPQSGQYPQPLSKHRPAGIRQAAEQRRLAHRQHDRRFGGHGTERGAPPLPSP